MQYQSIEYIRGDIMDNIKNNFTKRDIKIVMIGMIETIRIRYNNFIDIPDEAESVHKLRVSIRQTRSMFSFLRPVLDQKECRMKQAKLKDIANKFSYIRELDVILEEWKNFIKNNSNYLEYKVLINILKEEHEKEKIQILENFYSNFANEELDNMVSWINQWEENDDEFVKFILDRFTRWNDALDTALKNLDYDDYEKIHDLRIKFKKVRYVQNNIKFLSSYQVMDLEELKDMQDDLGVICDTYVNISILDDLNSKYNSKNLKKETDIFKEYLLNTRESLKKKVRSKNW